VQSRQASSSTDNCQSVHLELIDVIFQIQPLYVDFSSEQIELESDDEDDEDEDSDEDDEETKNDPLSLDIIHSAMYLNINSSTSETKRRLSLEYVKCCLEFFTVEMLYRKEDLRRYSQRKLHFQVLLESFLKVQDRLLAVADDLSIENGFPRKVLELLRKLPHVENCYFRSLLTWMISTLLLGKEVDPLLFEIWDSPELFQTPKLCYDITSFFPLYFILLKYYLPEKYSAEIDETIVTAVHQSPVNNFC
jgi:hypothetical protein